MALGIKKKKKPSAKCRFITSFGRVIITHTHTHTSELKPLYQSALLSCYRHILSSVYSSRASLRCDGALSPAQLSRGLKPARAESADTTPPPHPPAFTLTHAHARSCGGCYFHPNTTVPPPPSAPPLGEVMLPHSPLSLIIRLIKLAVKEAPEGFGPTGSRIRGRGQRPLA